MMFFVKLWRCRLLQHLVDPDKDYKIIVTSFLNFVEMVSQSWNQLYPWVFEASEAIVGFSGLYKRRKLDLVSRAYLKLKHQDLGGNNEMIAVNWV
ncbi:MAG: hypothetical protein KGJ35_01205 [Patescibacteria group bacterium]|nr:hypothetical protein [Patescibacteria group bacterium]